jgi:hypothetical protein
MHSNWPTPVRPDGTSPTSLELVTSADRGLVRQALYQMQAAQALEGRGDTVAAFQAPLIGDRVRITVPLVLARHLNPDVCVYTEAEVWTADRVAALQDWIRDLREESDSPVMVVSREPSTPVARLGEVAEFIHLPYDGLPE